MAVFVAVAEEQGFASAARRLNLSAPSITRAINELESRLGARLFHRTTRSVRLSEAGQRYLADCQRILVEIEEADSHAAGLHATPVGSVSISASMLFGRMVIAPIIYDLLRCYDEISVSALFVDRVVSMLDEGVDVAVRIAHLPDSTLSAVRVGTVRRVLCASPTYLAKHGRPETLSDLHQHDTIEFNATALGGEWLFRHEGRSQRFKPKSRLMVNNADIAIAAARANHGITRVLSYMIDADIRQGSLEILLPDYELAPIPIHVLHKETGRTSARIRAVVDFLVERLRQIEAIRS